MYWTFEKVFYGERNDVSVSNVKQFLAQGYCPIPYTLFEGHFKAVHRVGDHDKLASRIEKPFPDAIIAQKPEGRFAMHLSGGYDSALLAQLYDGPNVDYLHLIGPETPKARILAATLKGTLHELTVTAEAFIEAAETLIPQMREPYAFNDVVFAYIASRKAKELGHTLVLTGDGGDPVFGGYNVGIDSGESADIWKTLEPHRILGLESFQPLMHTILDTWSKTTVPPQERKKDKLYLRRYLRELGMPQEIVMQQKVPWAGSLGIRDDQKVIDHMQAAIDASDYRWISGFTYPTPPVIGLQFRQYELVKHLEAAYKRKLDKAEIDKFSQDVRQLNAIDEATAQKAKRKAQLKSLIPPLALRAAEGVRRRRAIKRLKRDGTA
jgi:asparagine synthetase B (glutamine-hydrolysing)